MPDLSDLYDAALNEAERGAGVPLYTVDGALGPSDFTVVQQEGDTVAPTLSIAESLLGNPSQVKPATWFLIAVVGLLLANFLLGNPSKKGF